MNKETAEHYIKRMTGTKEIFKPTGFIGVQRHNYRNKKMIFLSCYTGCIYNAGQPVAKFWISPTDAVHLAWQLLEHSQIWNIKKRSRQSNNRKAVLK